jgi:hypothetical protein
MTPRCVRCFSRFIGHTSHTRRTHIAHTISFLALNPPQPTTSPYLVHRISYIVYRTSHIVYRTSYIVNPPTTDNRQPATQNPTTSNFSIPRTLHIVYRISYIVNPPTTDNFSIPRTSFIVHCTSYIVNRISYIVYRISYIAHRISYIVNPPATNTPIEKNNTNPFPIPSHCVFLYFGNAKQTYILMKRILAIAFLSLYLFSTTEFHELLKLPAMASHYQEHQKEMPNITFWKFICIHYAHGDVQDRDHDKDMKLPFKTHDGCSSASFISLIPEQKYTLHHMTALAVTKSVPNHYTEFLCSRFMENIWQPPKIS